VTAVVVAGPDTTAVALSASANCSACGMHASLAGASAGRLAHVSARAHADQSGHPVDVIIVTRETITRGDT